MTEERDDLAELMAMRDADETAFRTFIIGEIHRTRRRLEALESAFIVGDNGARDFVGHRLHHEAEVASRTGWAETWGDVRKWAIRGALGALAGLFLFLALSWHQSELEKAAKAAEESRAKAEQKK